MEYRSHPHPREMNATEHLLFTERLMQVAACGMYGDSVWWDAAGDAFSITPEVFTEKILSKHPLGNDFSAFTSNLSKWGFQKVTDPFRANDNVVTYRHDLFQRDRPNLIKYMKPVDGSLERGIKPSTASSIGYHAISPTISHTPSTIHIPSPAVPMPAPAFRALHDVGHSHIVSPTSETALVTELLARNDREAHLRRMQREAVLVEMLVAQRNSMQNWGLTNSLPLGHTGNPILSMDLLPRIPGQEVALSLHEQFVPRMPDARKPSANGGSQDSKSFRQASVPSLPPKKRFRCANDNSSTKDNAISPPYKRPSRGDSEAVLSDSSSAGHDSSIRAKQADQWYCHFEELCRYRERTGNTLIPHCFMENPPLARWVKRQRYQYTLRTEGKASTLTPDRVKALDSIGFVWDSHAIAWDKRMEELKEFRREHQHCNVPTSYVQNPQLARWVKCQRRQYKLYQVSKSASNMTPERIQQLEKVGFEWELRTSRYKKTT